MRYCIRHHGYIQQCFCQNIQIEIIIKQIIAVSLYEQVVTQQILEKHTFLYKQSYRTYLHNK